MPRRAKKPGKTKTPVPADSSTPDRATAYARAVYEGEILAGPYVRAACERHLKDLQSGPERGLFWDRHESEESIQFFAEVLRLAGGEFEGRPFLLEPWQCFIVGSIFGWKGSDGFRRFRVAYVETGKGSGKSPLAAGIGLKCLVADREPRAEIYAAATKKDQARVLFRDAVAMVEQSRWLDSKLHLSGGQDPLNIAFLAQGSFFRPISTEERGIGQSGPRPHCALLDEIHEHRSNAMVEFMRAGTKGRRQALMFMITNSGSDRTSVCWEYHNYGAKVSTGDLEDDSFFAYICAVDEDDDPFHDEACWPKANPSLGVTFGPKYLREQVRQAKGMPSKQNIVLRLNFCVWTDSEDAWISKDAWDAIETDVNLPDLRGRECCGGLDLSSKLDLTCFCPIFEFIKYDRWRIEDLRRELDAEGVLIELREFGQGYKDMSPAVDRLEELVLSDRLRVARNPVMRWNAASAVLMKDPAGNRKFTKEKSTGRIDGVVALAMGVAAATGEGSAPASPFEDPEYRMQF